MEREDFSTDQPKTLWHIDLDWLQQHRRSILALLRGCLCPACRRELKIEQHNIPESELMTRIKDCCSHNPGYITGQLPIMESLFRFFLANGNQPMSVEEIGRQLSERRGGDISRTSEQILLRLLRNDRYYGFQPVAD